MAPDEFNKVVESTITEIQRLLTFKGGEYAHHGDRLANFKSGSLSVGVTQLQVAMIYASKHWEAINTFVRDDAAGKTRIRLEPIDGRFDDLINYCILMKAILREQNTGGGGICQ